MYISTRNNSKKVNASEVIIKGMVPGGGLYIPEEIPVINMEDLKGKMNVPYAELAEWVFSHYLDDFTEEEIKHCVQSAYSNENFDIESIVPVVKLDQNIYILELWHGPTAAFKDMALQVLPHLLTTALKKHDIDKDIVILVATSGDTGKAALEGFKNVDGTQIIVFYPHGGVSEVQELQMLTTDGNNTYMCAVEGNFDDCQTAVKEIFSDSKYGERISEKGFFFSSANSINWGRLMPQIVYYFSAYLQLVRREQVAFGEDVDFVVPTGNFGNILAGWYAREMGLPIKKLICASNENNVLTDFFHTGVYDTNRDFIKTESPSMDILVSSNLERFLYLMNGQNGDLITQWMASLNKEGRFEIDGDTKKNIDEVILAGSANDTETKETIHSIYDTTHYLLDTHTAVAVRVGEQFELERPRIIDATAHPFKFVGAVHDALYSEENLEISELALIEHLSDVTNTPVHRALSALQLQGARPVHLVGINDLRNEIEIILSDLKK